MAVRNLRDIVSADKSMSGVCMIATAVIGSAVIGGVSSAVGANSAASAEKSAANQSNALLQSQYNQTRADLSPYNTAGQADMAKYNDLLGTGSGGMGAAQSTLSSIPGYQFTLQQGLKSTQNAAAARGLGVSGAALKGASTYATGLANSTYGTYANQLLAGANTGESAAAGTAQANNAVTGAQAGNITGAGNATAAADTATGNAVGGSLSNGLNSLFLFNALNKGAGTGLYGNSSNAYSTDGGY